MRAYNDGIGRNIKCRNRQCLLAQDVCDSSEDGTIRVRGSGRGPARVTAGSAPAMARIGLPSVPEPGARVESESKSPGISNDAFTSPLDPLDGGGHSALQHQTS